ncbi:unnamed protein product [Symbiodinium sp. CCMP2456]|nr:unnamed protein product [Symbiodinium sp. CCMP2456]
MTDPQSLHKSAWTHVRRFGEDAFPVFNLTPKKRQGSERDFESPPMEPLLKPWLAEALSGLQGGVRSASSEMIVYVANLVSQGVVSSAKQTFLVQSLQSAAANHPNSFVAVVILPNRACDESYLLRKKEEPKDVKEESQEPAVEAEDEEQAEKMIDVEAMTSLRDFKYNFQVLLQEPARQLSVRNLTLIFEESTIYGQRPACHEAWLVTRHGESGGTWLQSVCVVRVTCNDSDECPAMFVDDAYEELRQHLGGTAVIKKILTSLDIAKSKTVVVDLFAHDGWVPLACLQLHIENLAIACGSIAHTDIEYKFTKEVLLHDFFDRAKTKQLSIAGFPDFTAALSDLSKVHTDSARSDYDYLVTVPVGANLIVLEGLIAKFQNSVFAGEFAQILKKHDDEFNKDHKKASLAEAKTELESVRRKREANTPRKLEKAYDDMTKFREEHKLNAFNGVFEFLCIEFIRLLESTCGDVNLYYDPDENTLWVGSDRICGIPAKTEWLGFGSGNFVDGPTAKDVLSDGNGRWYRYSLAGPLSDVFVIFESDRKLSDDLKSLPVVSLKEFLVAMEDKGEIVSFMGHTKDNEQLQVNENIVFIMDEVKSSPTKKRRVSKALLGLRNVLFQCIPPPVELAMFPPKSKIYPEKSKTVHLLWQVRALTFGAHMDAAKLRSVRSPFKLSWRVRPAYELVNNLRLREPAVHSSDLGFVKLCTLLG